MWGRTWSKHYDIVSWRKFLSSRLAQNKYSLLFDLLEYKLKANNSTNLTAVAVKHEHCSNCRSVTNTDKIYDFTCCSRLFCISDKLIVSNSVKIIYKLTIEIGAVVVGMIVDYCVIRCQPTVDIKWKHRKLKSQMEMIGKSSMLLVICLISISFTHKTLRCDMLYVIGMIHSAMMTIAFDAENKLQI